MIDPTVQLLLEKAIDTPTKLQLLLIFYENPQLDMTPVKMSERSCRDIWSVTQALQELAEDGVLRVRAGSTKGDVRYTYLPRPEYVEPIRQLVRNYNDPLERDVLHRSIRDLEAYAPFRRQSTREPQVLFV